MKPLLQSLAHSLACTLALCLSFAPALANEKTNKEYTSPQTAESPDPARADMLRFTNDDTLHGQFISFNADGNLVWKNPESLETIPFSTKNLHRIVLNHGQAHQSLQYQSAIHLINGDVIPGKIISANESSVTISTEHLETITITRDNITKISTSPFGGKLFYFGPLNAQGWKTIKAVNPKEKKEPSTNTDNKNTAKPTQKEEKPKTDWKYTSNAWYSGTDKFRYLIKENALPDQCRLSFKLEWRGSLYTTVILHADFAPPEYTGDENNRLANSSAPGHAYLLNISPHSATLTSLTYDKKTGKPQLNQFTDSRVSLALTNKDETKIEIRIDRIKKAILFYSDGHFRGKWALGETYDGKGNDLAFYRPPHYNNSKIKISNIAISAWNGMKDSAQSMSHTKRDIILLNNGVDRFSGTFKNIHDGKVRFTGSYNNPMTIPLDEVEEIYLATSKQTTPPETAKDAVYFFVYPYGRITGIPSASTDGKTILTTSLLQDIPLDTRFINIIDFSQKNSLLDLWDDNF